MGLNDIRKTVMKEINMMQTRPKDYMVAQFLKIVELGESGKLMPKDEFIAMLKEYAVDGKLPAKPE